MFFCSQLFLFVFLPITLLSYFAIGSKDGKNTLLLLASIFFYCWGEPRFFPIAFLAAVADYFLCQKIHFYKGTKPRKAQFYLTVGIALNLSLMVYYKYLDFFISASNSILQYTPIHSLPLVQIALPIGISFIVFEKITYLVDVYRNLSHPSKSLKTYCLYVFLFPKLLAGPIVKFHDIERQLMNHTVSLDNFLKGLKRFLLGLVKKVLLADTIAELANSVFALNPTELGFYQAWLGIIAFSLQIYLDFSAYSDMAIGLARMFGFSLLENFNMPYTATSFTDFWRRWHISLSTWIREYLYYPLGGNRGGTARTYFNLWLCFLLSGLWHGANWTFILWGAYNGFFLMFDKLIWLRVSTHLPRFCTIAITLFFVMLGWVIFRSSSLEQMMAVFNALVDPARQGKFIVVSGAIWTALSIGTVISIVPASSLYAGVLSLWRSMNNALAVENWALSALSFFAAFRVITSNFNPFLYFRF